MHQNGSQYKALLDDIWRNTEFFYQSVCPKPCIEHHIKGTLSVKEIPGTPGNESMIAIYFSSLDSSISRELTLFGPTSIIASVGGSLGLFLGFSCLDAALSIVERIKGLFLMRRISR